MDIEHTTRNGEEETNVLQYVNSFRSLSKSLRANLDNLLSQKRQQNVEGTKQHSETIDKSFQSLIELRTNHRSLYLEIEKNRLQTQKEKEKIDIVASELEELTYLRDSIVSEINISKNRTFPQLSQLENLNVKVKENDTNLTPQNIRDSHNELLTNFNVELENRKKAKLEYERKEEDKNGLIKKCEEDRNFLAKIPQHIQKVTESCKPLQHLYKTGVSSNYDQVQHSKSLPPQLYWLYKKLVTIKEAKLDENVEIEIKENPEAAEKFGFSKLQIVFSILKDRNDPSLKKYSEILNEKSFFSGVYPLKFYFSFLPTYDFVLVNLENKHFFTADEILSRIVEDDSGTKLYSNPKNDSEKNFNTKYSLFLWIQNLCKEGKTISFVESHEQHSSKIATLTEIVKAIRKRVVNRLLLKYQFDNLRTNKQVPNSVLKIFDMNESPVLNIEILTCNKISKEDYIRCIEVPTILKEKEDVSNQILGERTLSQKIQEFFDRKQNRSSVRVYGHGTKELAYSKQTNIGLETRGRDESEDFYRIEFSHPKYKITGYIIINFDYPNSDLKMVFNVVADIVKESKIPDSILQKCSAKTLQQIKAERNSFAHKINPKLYNVIEKTLNQKANLPDPAFTFAYKILLLMMTVQKQLE